MNYLLDTCVISEFVRKNPEKKVLDWIEGREEERLFLSVLTFGELAKGIAKLTDPMRAKRLKTWVEHDLQERFAGRILPITLAIATTWGDLQGQGERKGTPVPAIDGLIVATALVEKMTVVTRNTKDMISCGVEIVNPWVDS